MRTVTRQSIAHVGIGPRAAVQAHPVVQPRAHRTAHLARRVQRDAVVPNRKVVLPPAVSIRGGGRRGALADEQADKAVALGRVEEHGGLVRHRRRLHVRDVGA